MKKKHIFATLALSVAVFVTGLAAPTLSLAGSPHLREGWQLGFSYGYSTGRVTLANQAEGDGEGGATPQMRLGHMVGKNFALGVEYSGWMLEGGDADLKIRSSMQQIMVAGTWYPGDPDRASGGFYMRGGVGLGWASVAEVEIFDQLQEHGLRKDESGLGLLAAIGYEFRVTNDVAAGLGWGFNYLSINKDIYESGWFTPLTATLAWYWN